MARFGSLRLAALKHASQMATASALAQPINAASSWIPLGPTAIPNGEPISRAAAPTGIFVTGRLTAIAIDQNDSQTIYVGAAMGGVWKTTDGGGTWSPMSDSSPSLAIGAIALDPTNSNVLYAGTGEGNHYYGGGDLQLPWNNYAGVGLLKSTDAGATWSLLGATEFDGACFFRIAIDGASANTLFVATSGGLYRSQDAGASWQQMSKGTPLGTASTDVVIDPKNPSTVYAGFWDRGVYKSTNADAVTPTWALIDMPWAATEQRRVALAMSSSSPSAPQKLYAALSGKIGVSTDGGGTWKNWNIANAKVDGYRCLLVPHPTQTDIIYINFTNALQKVDFSSPGNPAVTTLSDTIHADQHALAFDSKDASVLYVCNDGGIFRSDDDGNSWSDAINRNLSITQFTFIDQHPVSDALLHGGTQDNGTNQFRGNPVFYHSDDFDGGAIVVDQNQPQNVVHHREENKLARSTTGGSISGWSNVSPPAQHKALPYPPLALAASDPQRAAFGWTGCCFFDSAQGSAGWLTPPVNLKQPPDETENVSALYYADSNTVYVGTIFGGVFLLKRQGGNWTSKPLHAAPLPQSRYVWAIRTDPTDPDAIIVVLSGSGCSHVWKGRTATSGAFVWTDISGAAGNPKGTLPDIGVYALCVAPANAMYVGTEIGVFCTTDGGNTWAQFSEGLPPVPVTSLRLSPSGLLRAATHGRGIWERDLTGPLANANLFLRDNVLSTGRTPPLEIAVPFSEPAQGVSQGDVVRWWQCADIKVDTQAPTFQFDPKKVDYIVFESALKNRSVVPGQSHRIYIQLHNRGPGPATNVTIKLLYTDSSGGLGDLPADFWSKFPADSNDTSVWKPIGTPTTIQSIAALKPEVVTFEWTPGESVQRPCFLVVADCANDPIPAANKIYRVQDLVQKERHIGLRASKSPI